MTEDAAISRRALQPPELFDARSVGYSHAVATTGGRLVHIAGQVAEGQSAAEQVTRALEAVDACCRSAGGALADVVWMTWYTTEAVAELWAATAESRRRLLPDPPPAMTVVRVVGLADPKYKVEITGFAVVASGREGVTK